MIENWLKEKLVAHRGLHNNEYPENTLVAYNNAIKNGYNIELDVQLSKDKVPVIYHDLDMTRLTTVPDLVKNLTYSELKEKVRYKSNLKYGLPSFCETLELCENKTGLMIEIKKDDYFIEDIEVEKIILPYLNKYKGNFIVKSFNPYTVKWFLDNAPSFCIGLLCDVNDINDYPVKCRQLVNEILFNAERKVDFFDYDVNRIGSNIYNSVKESNIPCVIWTVKNQETLDKYKNEVVTSIFEGFIPRK